MPQPEAGHRCGSFDQPRRWGTPSARGRDAVGHARPNGAGPRGSARKFCPPSQGPRPPGGRRWPRGEPPSGRRLRVHGGVRPQLQGQLALLSCEPWRSPAPRRTAWRAAAPARPRRLRPTPPPPLSPCASRAEVRNRCQAVRPWISRASAARRRARRGSRRRCPRAPPRSRRSRRRQHRDHPRALLGAPGHLAARDQRQLVAGQVGVLALVGVGEVDPGARHFDQDLALAAARAWAVGHLEDLWAAELLDLDRAHARAMYRRPLGSAAAWPGRGRFDRLRRDQVSLRRARARCSAAPPCTSRWRRASSPTFAWSARWATTSATRSTPCSRHEVDTTDWSTCGAARRSSTRRLRVRPQHRPLRGHAARRVRRLPAQALGGLQAGGTLFLANIQPDLQREVREQCRDARLAGLDSMNFWIESARESLCAPWPAWT